jgi:hypothetical protein
MVLRLFNEGRITETWALNDTFGKAVQLGDELIPPGATGTPNR